MELATSQAEIPSMGYGPVFVFAARHLKYNLKWGESFLSNHFLNN